MSHIIRFREIAGPFKTTIPDGSWLATYADTPDGRGHAVWTTDAAKALRFDSAGAALDFWRQQSVAVPRRYDGKANRPLTAFTVEIEKV